MNRSFRIALLVCLGLGLTARAQDGRFFRVTGPEAVVITSLTTDGFITWTNAPSNAVFTIQTTISRLGGTNWADSGRN